MRNPLKTELIGRTASISNSRNNKEIATGQIIDETKNTMVVRHAGKRKMIAKEQCAIQLRGMGHSIDGKMLVGRPEDRIKKIR